jgi:photosystem II stability/assembly factor-like uncharacterized protein
MLFTRNVVRVAVYFGAVAMMLVGCFSSSAIQKASAAPKQASSSTWRAENSGTKQRLYDVACLSTSRCLAVGAAGTIVSTSNGGHTWRSVRNPLRGSSKPVYQIACVAPSSCYAIARPDTILVTHNSGATWSRHVLSVGVSGSNLTDKACLAAYPPDMTGRYSLCRLGLLDVSCVSAKVCYAVSASPSAYDATPIPKTPHPAPSTIWLTRDGGATWTRQSIPAGVPCNGDCQTGLYGYPVEWVTCLSSGQCRAGGGQFLECGHCGFAFAVLVTRAPGKPWACTPSSCVTFAPDVATCPTSSRCYGVDNSNPFSVPANSVLRSTNGGANWGQIGSDWTKSVLNDIACSSSLTCYLAGTHGSVARITNGNTLTAQRTPTTHDLYGIACTPCACYAVGDNGTILVN